MLPFTRAEFVTVFAQYNLAVWPAPIVAYALGLAMVVAVLRPSRSGDRLIVGGLAMMWLWTGIAYHGLWFSSINPAAFGFAALFVLQGVLLAIAAVRGSLQFAKPARASAWMGLALVAYALVLYPLIGALAGDHYPGVPVFGIAPCPVVIFTFGLLLMASTHVSRWLLVVPLAWALVGGSASFLLGIPQDWMLLVSGLAAPAIVLRERRGARPHPAGVPSHRPAR